MPLQNRVTPFGELIATSARGTMMGNRGILHNASGELAEKRWTHQSWVACLLEFKGRKAVINAPHSYTQLFFLDEATALAAGHRPCAECRREDFHRFRDAWLRGNPDSGLDDSSSIAAIDRVIHAQRVTRNREKIVWKASLRSLPDAVFVELSDRPGAAFLKWHGKLNEWRPDGYSDSVVMSEDSVVNVLTPQSIVAAIKAGYCPSVAVE